MTNTYDVIIVGLGGMGSCAAYQVARRGKRVLGLERHTPAHALGSSHGKSRIIRQAYFEDPAYVPLLLRAYELWEQIERETNQSIMMLTGGLMMGRPDAQTVAGALRSAREYNLPYEMLDAAAIHTRFPAFQPDPATVALYEKKAGYVRPEVSVQAHLTRAAALGADLHFEEPIQSWSASPTGDRVQVTTANGVYEAEKLIIAPGAWAPQLLADLSLPLVVERNILFWFDPLDGTAPFLADRFPIYIWEINADLQIYGFPAEAGSTDGVKIALFRNGNISTPETIDRTVHPDEVQQMRDAFKDHIPALNGPLLNALTCMYTTTPDQHFIIDLHPNYPQVVIASPCSGHGFKFASVVGEILADLALDGSTRHPISLFALDRFVATH